jgi:hypothetical protein
MNDLFREGFEKSAGLKEGLYTLKLVLKHGPKKAKKIIAQMENKSALKARQAVDSRFMRMKSPSKMDH